MNSYITGIPDITGSWIDRDQTNPVVANGGKRMRYFCVRCDFIGSAIVKEPLITFCIEDRIAQHNGERYTTQRIYRPVEIGPWSGGHTCKVERDLGCRQVTVRCARSIYGS